MMTVKDILNLTDVKNQNLPKIVADSAFKKYDVLYLPVFEESAQNMMKDCKELKSLKLTGKKKEAHNLVVDGQLWKVRGMGKKGKMTPRTIRRMFGSMFLGGEVVRLKSIAILCDEADWAYFAAIGIHVAALNPSIYKPKAPKKPALTVALVNESFKGATLAKVKKEVKRGENTAEAKNLMRILGATPPNSLSTEAYAEVVQKLARKWGVKCKNVSKRELKKYELLNAVSHGSGHDSKLLILTIPVKGSKKNTVVVGKGICYDSGGMQGKGSHMKSMKEDMAGSASVLSTVLNIVKNKHQLKETTHFLLPLAENMMGTSAQRADDVWTAGDGQTVEIVHTDAEGRLVMGDAICYAKNNLKNIDKVYTIATLTGSCVVALGEVYTGNLCNDDELRQEAVEAGQKTGDLVFSGPWDLEYDDNISPVADVANLGQKERDAGWLKAGYYLARFVPKDKKTGEHTAKFCHFDIAGSIDMDGSGAPHRRKGFSSGVGVGFLTELLSK